MGESGAAIARALQGWSHTAFIRVAKPADATIVCQLVHDLAEFENLSHVCKATEDSMQGALANQTPCKVTVLLLEIAENPRPTSDVSEDLLGEVPPEVIDGRSCRARLPDGSGIDDETPVPIAMRDLCDVIDPSRVAFSSTVDSNRVVVGFVLFYPNFSTYLAKPSVHIEDLFIRAPYRGRKFGSMLLTSVAKRAARQGAQRLEWMVLDWNEKAISFYESMGAKVHSEWRICRLSGDDLAVYASGEPKQAEAAPPRVARIHRSSSMGR